MNGYLTRAIGFSASHRYFREDWSERENRERFGDGALGERHAHVYRVEVTVKGPIDEATGMVIALGALDSILSEEIVERFDGKFINDEVERFAAGGWVPTTESLAAYMVELIDGRLPPSVTVHRVRVMEDRDLWSDVYGED